MAGQPDVDLTLVEEKRHLQHLNVGLSEKVAALQSREARARAELKDAKETAELLEFRVLELEDEKDRAVVSHTVVFPTLRPFTLCSLLQANQNNATTVLQQDSPTLDSGCNTSLATDEDPLERYLDFRKEKVTDTKHKLQALVSATPEAGDKSLLLQSVALLETLLSKIHNLQAENEGLKRKVEREEEVPYGEVVLELENTRTELDKAKQVDKCYILLQKCAKITYLCSFVACQSIK